MNAIQQSKLTMYTTVVNWMDTSLAQVQHLPALTTLLEELKGHMVDINNYSTVQQIGTKGYTKQKAEYKEKLTHITIEVLNALKAYAAISENIVLAGEVDFSPSELEQTNATILNDKVGVILQKATENLQQLAPYGTLQENLTQLQEAQQAYVKSIATPRAGIINRKQATAALAEIFDKVDALLTDKIDKLLLLLQTKDAATYSAYRSARQVVW